MSHGIGQEKNDVIARSNSWLWGEPGSERPWVANHDVLKSKELTSCALPLCRAIFIKFRGPQKLSDKEGGK